MKKMFFAVRILIFLFLLLTSNAFAFKSQVVNIKTYAEFSKGTFDGVKADRSFGGCLVLNKDKAGYLNDGKYLLAFISPEFPFNEAVLSWCVETKEETALDFYLRVKIGGRWSDWERMARWGGIKLEEKMGDRNKKNSGDLINLEIDTLSLKEMAEQIQIRIDFTSKNPENSPVVKMLSLCLSDNSALTPVHDKKIKIQKRKILNVPFFSQALAGRDISPYACGPTSIAMILGYYGINKNVREMAFRCYDEYNDAFGNWSFNIAAISELGLYGWVARLYSLEEVREEIDKGFPLMAGFTYNYGELTGSPCSYSPGHLLVIRGFDEDGNVVVNDPGFLYEADGFRSYDKIEFENIWQKAGGYVLIFRPDKF